MSEWLVDLIEDLDAHQNQAVLEYMDNELADLIMLDVPPASTPEPCPYRMAGGVCVLYPNVCQWPECGP